jgi:hypothetical protein
VKCGVQMFETAIGAGKFSAVNSELDGVEWRDEEE